MKKNTLLLLLLCSGNIWSQEYFPGGVAGAEAWYIANYSDIDLSEFHNEAQSSKKINSCLATFTKTLVNFNHAIGTDKLCLFYTAPMENTISRNIFFVGEPSDLVTPMSHLTTDWSESLLPRNDTVRNRFDVSNQSTFINKQETAFQSIKNANVNFYHWNIYQTDQKFKSYGYKGETTFSIGKVFANTQTTAEYFNGNFPEFISYPFELTANQKNRVESYLALKYGITLDSLTSYKNSKNVIFWNKSNNNLFGDRIFGIGRDDISGLNQLQSESIHFKDYLIASVKTLMPTNVEKQQLSSISNNNFIVFGDNDQPDGLNALNQFNVRTLKRKWLSQNTGEDAKNILIFFKLNLDAILKQTLFNDPTLKIWMLHDKYTNNQEETDFNSNYVDYYETASMDGIQYAYFENVFFDKDGAVYDQFTFGIGPEMIVQARFHPDCNGERLDTDIVITGGQAPYEIEIQNTNGYHDTVTVNQNVTMLTAETPHTYTINVTDSLGNTAEVVFEAVQYPMSLELGNAIILTASQQQATIDAGQGVTDPNATYYWELDGQPLNLYTSSITVSEPGTYSVTITSGNQACILTDEVEVYYNFTGTVSQTGCDKNFASINLSIGGGIPPYTTTVSSTNQTINQVHTSTNYVFSNIPFGTSTVTTTDSSGNIFQEIVLLEDPLPGIELDLLSQLQQLCGGVNTYYNGFPVIDCENDFILDASVLVTHPNTRYEWYRNGTQLNIITPTVLIDDEGTSTSSAPRIYMVKVINRDNECSLTESFVAKSRFRMHEVEQQSMAFETELEERMELNDTEDSYLKTRIYPNPSDTNTTFYYEVYSDQQFEGIVKIYTVTGSLVQQLNISGQSNYKLPFELLTAGVYFICTETNGILLTDKIIIQ